MILKLFLFAFATFSLHSQSVRTERINVNIEDSTDIYIGDSTSKQLFYDAVIPDKPMRGVVVLMNGTGDPTSVTASCNATLIEGATNAGFAIVIPSINQRIVLNDMVLSVMNTMLRDALTKYSLPPDKFIFGGYSIGGFYSMRYAEYAYENAALTVVRPRAVFNVDGPTDLANLWYKWTSDLSNPRNANKNEPRYALDELEKYIGGSPETHKELYEKYSAYSHSHPRGGAAQFLVTIPVRIYNDLDVSWWINNRGVDLYGMNALDHSALINCLVGFGNNRAEFINALGKGYRPDGRRHPHSWSIVDPKEIVQWFEKCLE